MEADRQPPETPQMIQTNNNNNIVNSNNTFTDKLTAIPKVVFFQFIAVCETIGERVASAIGLDESYFQEYVDTMSEEELRQAEEIHRQRMIENELYEATCALNNNNNQQSENELQLSSEGYSVVSTEDISPQLVDVVAGVPVPNEVPDCV